MSIFVKKLKDMVAEARTSRIQKAKTLKFKQPKLLTFDDYARLTPPHSGNYELHNGRIINIPSPPEAHRTLALKLTLQLGNYIAKNKLGQLLSPPIAVVFTPNDIMQPDILFVSNERLSIIDNQVKGAPDFIVEIGNTAKEMSYRKHIFGIQGVHEYWLINLNKHTITQYENIDDKLIVREKINIEGSLSSYIIEGFTVNARDIFE
jgi:Uma2 family endonuclease